jgi:hypothetical protein
MSDRIDARRITNVEADGRGQVVRCQVVRYCMIRVESPAAELGR